MNYMETGSGLLESVADLGESPIPVPRLLVELPPWHKVFRRNLFDLLRPGQEPPLRLASKPAKFWPDVFVQSRLPWRCFLESALYHAVLILMMWASSLIWIRKPQIAMLPALRHEDVIYYQASELLPPLDTGRAQPRQSMKGDPVYAPQPIISVPKEADNRRQTVVTPPKLKLDHDVRLPNVVSWPKAPLAVPMAATDRKTLAKAPILDPSVVAPPPDVKLASSRNAMNSLQPDVVQPSPTLDVPARRLGDINIAPSQVIAPAPQLAVEARRTQAANAGGATSVVPPAPSVSGTGMANSGSRLIALSMNPAEPGAPVDPPAGNRRGSFAATPQGKAGAAGTPDIVGTSHSAEAGSGNGSHSDAPEGLYVGAGTDPKTSAVGGNGKGSGSGGNGSASKDPVLMAKVTPPRVSTPQRQAEAVSGGSESELEKKVFGDRKFYSMTLNVPNFNSAGGSWVIHFAELNEDVKADKGELTAPSATAMSDPAYPLELMKQHVQGTVTLYAVISTDGTVRDVRVLNGVDDRLDRYASEALARWHFRPAKKDGNPVALEAVVKIPFRPSRMKPMF